MSRAAEIEREVSETHELVKPTEDRVMSRAGETARQGSETHALVKRNVEEGQGDVQMSRDGEGSVWNSRSGERMPRKDMEMSRWVEQQRWQGKCVKLTIWGKNAEEGEGDERSSSDGKRSVWNSRAGEK
jgi:hypothetical protein